MILDISQFGAGLGLIMVGWVCGLIASIVFSITRGVSRI